MRMINADELLMLIDNHDNMVLKAVNSSCLKDVYKMAHVHIKDLIETMPTIERKTGKWEQDNPFTKPVCSECGEPCFGLHGFDYACTPYCPNCGADMRGDKHEND